jgi:hypothetical protein
MFDVLGGIVAIYTVYAALRGDVIAKAGPWGRRVSRTREPAYFWTVIAIYGALSFALVAVF